MDIALHGAAIITDPVAGEELQKEGRFMIIPRTGTTVGDEDVSGQRLIDQR